MSTADNNATAIDTVTEGIDKVDISDNNDNTSEVIQETCASCGKESKSEDMNTCNKCKSVKYCNAACKKKHRKKHKKACDRRVAELHEERLFKELEPVECPICFQPMPIESREASFKSCCGKEICNGCIYEMECSDEKGLCPFCRTRNHIGCNEKLDRLKKLMDNGNAYAYNIVAFSYSTEINDLPRDYNKACELYLKAGELGCPEAYHNLGCSYYYGTGVERDMKKAKYYYELAAMGGRVHTRNLLGCMEGEAGCHHRAMKHFLIAARAGDKDSMHNVQIGFRDGIVTKDEFASTLRAHKQRLDEMKSDARAEAAASGLFSSG